MRKLVYGAFSPDMSFHVYEEDNGKLVDGNGLMFTDKCCADALRVLNDDTVDKDIHYLIRQDASGWFCEFVAKYFPKGEVFVVGYGDSAELALADCQKKLARIK